ncbi:hypothetical protein ACHAQJ_000480 [Trichoderma viride]
MAQRQRGVRLTQVYASSTENDASVDIIAIHGLDTKSPDTWLWKPEDPNGPRINWLSDHNMLPSRVGPARIFTCDWPADMCSPSDSAPMELKECSRLLLAGIESRNAIDNTQASKQDRPIVFIASCLGGIILMQALVMADPDYVSIKKATRSIVFLATPFRGTSFQDIANWAEPGLKFWASARGKTVTTLLDSLKGPTFDLDELVRDFTQLCLDYSYQAQTFYESRDTRLYTKIPLANWSPSWLLDRSIPPKQLVDKTSASLDIVRHPLPLDRPHVTMNKFSGSNDPDYKLVSGKIEGILRSIRNGSPLESADAFIRAKHYTPDRLRIIRLSGSRLSMDQCYINLAILERKDQITNNENHVPSDLTLLARLKTVMPKTSVQIELQNIFNSRNESANKAGEPRRILIRGSAGIGKTTLCKKIVHDFTYQGRWSDLFDRLLWVPLRRIKNGHLKEYDLGNLFHQEFFSQLYDGRSIANAMWKNLERINFSKTLFVLDGLDEVSEGLEEDDTMNSLLKFLLDLPNVIITSRPHVNLPSSAAAIDLEVETIGFYPDQVNEYLQKTIQNPTQVEKIQSFLQDRWLLQSLVRIPIQLDALCYTWEEESDLDEDMSQTMTAIYAAIELKLWKKDIIRLGIRTQDKIKNARSELDIIQLVDRERQMLEAVAFSGLFNDTMNFDSKYRDKVYAKLKIGSPTTEYSWDDTLERLSFLRTSDSSPETKYRSYHFLHLTFQEYFAARYFVRKWLSQEQLDCIHLNKRTITNIEPASFFRKHKYTEHYDVFWRFVAGLLDAQDEALSLFEMMENEPRDLLGSTHQRLVMHCLNEVSSEMPMRPHLEQKMVGLPLFEFQSHRLNYPHLVQRMGLRIGSEMEFPPPALDAAFAQGTRPVKLAILKGLEARPRVPLAFMKFVIECFSHDDAGIQRGAYSFLLRCQSPLPCQILEALTALCESESLDIQTKAICILIERSTIPSQALQALQASITSSNSRSRYRAHEVLYALSSQSTLSDEILKTAVAWLDLTFALKVLLANSPLPCEILNGLEAIIFKGSDGRLNYRIIQILQAQPSLPDNIQKAVLARLDHKDIGVRLDCIEILSCQPGFLNNVTDMLVALVNDEDAKVQHETLTTLRNLKNIALPDKVLETLLVVAQSKESNVVAFRQYHVDYRPTAMAVHILQNQLTLPHDMINALVAQLTDKDSFIRGKAVQVLSKQLAGSDEIRNAIAACFKDTDSYVRRAVVGFLRGRDKLALSDEIIIDAVACLSDTDEDIQLAALRILNKISKRLLLNSVVTLSKYEKSAARQVAVHDLEAMSTPTLYGDILKATPALLKKSKSQFKSSALGVLRSINASNLPDEILISVVSILLEGESLLLASLRVLNCQTNLPEWALQAVSSLLEREDCAEYLNIVEAMLRRHVTFYGTLLGGTYAARLYEILLLRSFRKQLSLYIEDGALCINAPGGFTRIFVLDVQGFTNKVETWRAEIEARTHKLR